MLRRLVPAGGRQPLRPARVRFGGVGLPRDARRHLSIVANEKQANAGKTVAVGLSGGVDSAVAAFLLKKQGYNVVGVHMTNWDGSNEDNSSCTAEVDADDAERTAKQLGISFHHVNHVESYWTQVWETCLEQWERGWNPNPDVLCNREIKFAVFQRQVMGAVDADFFATGHYARVLRLPRDHLARPGVGHTQQLLSPSELGLGVSPPVLSPPGSTYQQLYKASAEAGRKDQSYFLSAVPYESFENVIFPVGDIPKSAVRRIAKELGLKVAVKKDSTGICFIGERNFPDFIQQYIQPKPGMIMCKDTGKILGSHRGVFVYTIGQRISVGGLPQKYYVAEKCTKSNRVFAVAGQYHPSLYAVSTRAERVHWLVPPDVVQNWPLQTEEGLRCRYMVSYLGHEGVCTVRRVEPAADSEPGEQLEVIFDVPHRAVTPGQTIVFYLNDACIGSAQISATMLAEQTELGRNPDGSLKTLDRYQVNGIDP